MVHDSDIYRKAASVSLIGLLLQAVLAVVLGMLGAYSQSSALLSACWMTFISVPAWLILLLIFSQLRKECEESREVRALATRADASGMFEEATLQEIRRRIERLYRWGLPSVSIGMSVVQMGLGVSLAYLKWKQFQGLAYNEPADLRSGVNPVLVLLLLLLVAVAAFFMARYVAGMTREKVWSPLRGGASVLLSTCLVCVVLGVAMSMSVWTGFHKSLHIAAVAIPAFTALLGMESFIVLLLGLYRPRKGGEAVRPAFDSRLLGWLTAPKSLGQTLAETLRYQFGFEVSGSWAFKLVSRALLPMMAAAIALLWICSCFFIVAPHERAVVMVNGKMQTLAGPGLHFKIPWPFATVRDRVSVDRLRRVVVCQSGSGIGSASEELLMTSGGEMIAADVTVLYRVAKDHEKIFVQSSENPEALISAVASDAVSRYLSGHSTLDLLGPGRAAATETLCADIAAALPISHYGIEVVEVSLSGMRPPRDATDGFLEMVNARQEREKMVAEARRESGMILTAVVGSYEQAAIIKKAIDSYNQADDAARVEARGKVEALIESADGLAAETMANARADRWRRDLTERGNVHEFSSLIEAYRIAPDFLKERLMLEARAGLANRQKTVLGRNANGDLPAMNLNLSDTSGAGSILGGSK